MSSVSFCTSLHAFCMFCSVRLPTQYMNNLSVSLEGWLHLGGDSYGFGCSTWASAGQVVTGNRQADFVCSQSCYYATRSKVSLFNSVELLCCFSDVALPLIPLRHVQRTKLFGFLPLQFSSRYPPAAPPQRACVSASPQGWLLELGEAESKAEGQQMLQRKTVFTADVSANFDDEEFKKRGSIVLAGYQELQPGQQQQ